MSGHSKWAGIKHKKALVDTKRGKLFTKIIREITVATREGGGDPSANARLRKAIDDAKAANMPQDNIKRGIKKGLGELAGGVIEECVFEGYGPAGVAILVKALTDNRNRTTSDLRRIFSRNGGNMGEPGCVGWMFTQKGLIHIHKSKIGEEELMNAALEAGAEDFNSDDVELYEIITEVKDFENVKEKLKGIEFELAEITMLPQTYIKLEDKDAQQMLHLMDALDDNDDIQNVYANFDIPNDVMEKISQEE